MPNYKISPSAQSLMRDQAKALCDRRIALAEADFPLDFEEVQAAILPAPVRETMQRLIADGVDTISRDNDVYYILPSSVGTERRVVLNLRSGERFFNARSEVGYVSSISPYYLKSDDPRFNIDLSVVPPEKGEAVVKWVDNAVRERRMAEITQATVSWFLTHACLPVTFITAAHVMARWPTIALLVDGLGEGSYYKTKFREVPAKLDRWGWPPNDPARAKYAKAMKLADMFLTSAMMLPKTNTTKPIGKNEVRVSITEYQKFPGEKF
jgi:hypothetical protein